MKQCQMMKNGQRGQRQCINKAIFEIRVGSLMRLSCGQCTFRSLNHMLVSDGREAKVKLVRPE